MNDLQDIDINLLAVLDVVLTERNLTRAAEVLGTTQPTVSGAVRKLRALLDDPLLVRGGRDSQLTPKAAALQPLVNAAMAQVDRTLNLRPLFDPLQSDRKFRLSASDYALSVMTAPLLKVLDYEAPHTSIEFSPLYQIEPIDLLRDDVVIVGPRTGVPGKHKSLFSDSMVCIVRRDHPRLVDGRLSMEDLATLPYVRVTLGGVSLYADEVLDAAGVSPRAQLTVTGFLPVPFVVTRSDRFGFVPARIAELYADELDLAVARIPVPLPVLVESAYWHPSRNDDPALRWLISTLMRVAEQVEFGEDHSVG